MDEDPGIPEDDPGTLEEGLATTDEGPVIMMVDGTGAMEGQEIAEDIPRTRSPTCC
jgi:hypothetical protein